MKALLLKKINIPTPVEIMAISATLKMALKNVKSFPPQWLGKFRAKGK
jgi:hypothetical protein